MSYDKATILTYLRKILDKELVLPAIQRDFVWDEEHIYRLLDSILRAYPFGTLLFWNTKQRVQYREFAMDWSEDLRYTYNINLEGRKATLVLDGQQRLQSLYIALFGTLDNRKLYFDLLSGEQPEDVSQAKYRFLFMSPAEAERENQANGGKVHWIHLSEIVMLEKFGQMAARAQQLVAELGLSAASSDGMRVANNISTAYHALRSDEALNFYTLDKGYGDDGVITDQNEVLEVFVRVNSGGQVLTKSDLMFSLMQQGWEDAADSVADVVDALNKKGHYAFDKDFVLKCALACVGAGAKYEVDKLRSGAVLGKISQAFPRISDALVNCVDFIVDTGRFLDARILRSYNTLIPFVYFFYIQPDQNIRGEDVRLHMNQALYLSLMTAVFSRFADRYIDQAVANVLDPAHEAEPGVFPLAQYRHFVRERRDRADIDDSLLQKNIPLLMNMLDKGRVLPEGRRSRVPEYDHIFPRGKLLEYGYPDDLVNHYANMRLIPAKDNNWKRDQDPLDYFGSSPEVMDYYLIPPGLLQYEQFPAFVEARRALIWERVRTFLGLPKQPVEAHTGTTLPHLNPPPQSVSSEVAESEINTLMAIRDMLDRAPISDRHMVVFRGVYRAGDSGIDNRELADLLGLTPHQFAGLLGALGRRIAHTPACAQLGYYGIGLLFDITRSGGVWRYRMRPDFRQVLESEQIVSPAGSPDVVETQSSSITIPDGSNEPWNGEFYCSFGHRESRSWEDAVQYGFVSAGNGAWYSRTLKLLSPGDRIWVKVPRHGYTGVGRVTGRVQPAATFTVQTPEGESPVLEVAKRGHYFRELANDAERCEYFVPVHWLQTVPLDKAVRGTGLYGARQIVCRPTVPDWRSTVEYLKLQFPDFDRPI